MIDKLIKQVSYYGEHADKTLEIIGEAQLDSIEQTLYILIERLRNCCVSVRTLLKEYQTNGIQVHEFSIGILLRAVLLDALIGIYLRQELMRYLTEEEDTATAKFQALCKEFLNDGFDKTVQYAECLQGYGLISNNEVQDIYNLFLEHYPDSFESTLSNNKPVAKVNKQIKKGPVALFHSIAQGELKDSLGIYDAYLYYSKYDHMSMATYVFQRKHREEKEATLAAAINDLGFHSLNCHELLMLSDINQKGFQEQRDLILGYEKVA